MKSEEPSKNRAAITFYLTAGVVFVSGFLGCFVIQEVLSPGSFEQIGFLIYLCGPLPIIPAGLCLIGTICQFFAWLDQRRGEK